VISKPWMQHAEVRRRLERVIELNGGSLRRAADDLQVSPQYLSYVLAGRRGIGPRLLHSLKLRRRIEKVVTYQEVGRATR